MKRRTLLVTLLLFASACSPDECAAPEARGDALRPNVLFILADDLGWGDVGHHGGPYDTPNIDRLAAGGVQLSRHYVQPTCSPTRVELLTGLYASRFGLYDATNDRVLESDTLTLAGALQSRGYFTAITGKWHLGSKPRWGPRYHGFERSHGALAGGVHPYSHVYRRKRPSWYLDGERLREEGHATDLIAARAAGWIRDHGDRPFFIYVAFTAVHTPIVEPDALVARYVDRFEDEAQRAYAASVTHLDTAVGTLLDALEEAGLRDDTLVVFASDNGAPDPARNAPLRGIKGTLTEGGTRSPTIVSWPGRLAPRTVDAPTAIVDWMPTLAGLAGYERPPQAPEWDGVDIWPLLSGEVEQPEERVIFWQSVLETAVLRGSWKLVQTPGGGTRLYDVERDPGERHDRAEEEPERVAELLAILEATKPG